MRGRCHSNHTAIVPAATAGFYEVVREERATWPSPRYLVLFIAGAKNTSSIWKTCNHYFAPTARSVKYCHQRVCLSVCFFLRSLISITPCVNYIKFSVYVTCVRGSVNFWRQCNMWGISGALDDVTFSHNMPYVPSPSAVSACGQELARTA